MAVGITYHGNDLSVIIFIVTSDCEDLTIEYILKKICFDTVGIVFNP